MKKEVVSIYVDNKANVLTRVVSLYGRRGFNIDSLTVSATNDPDISRITVTFEGDNLTLHQIVSQTEKLEVVRSVKTLDGKRSFFRELLMVNYHAGIKSTTYWTGTCKKPCSYSTKRVNSAIV